MPSASRLALQDDEFGLGGSVADYAALLKPRVMSLVVFTGLTGLVVAPGDLHHWLSFVALLCIAAGAGASGVLNMWYDADIDAVMSRTAGRPIPGGRVTPGQAASFGAVLAVGSVLTLGLLVNWVSASLLAFTIGFYLVIYTMFLKRLTAQNIVIGGVAGALPPVIGWSAVTGAVELESLVLFLVIFIWTPPHFWALALLRCNDYRKAGVPMLPVVAGMMRTRREILIYSLVLAPVSLLPVAAGLAGLVYLSAVTPLALYFIWRAWALYSARDEKYVTINARRLFAYSVVFLFAVFGLLLLEAAIDLSFLMGIGRWNGVN